MDISRNSFPLDTYTLHLIVSSDVIFSWISHAILSTWYIYLTCNRKLRCHLQLDISRNSFPLDTYTLHLIVSSDVIFSWTSHAILSTWYIYLTFNVNKFLSIYNYVNNWGEKKWRRGEGEGRKRKGVEMRLGADYPTYLLAYYIFLNWEKNDILQFVFSKKMVQAITITTRIYSQTSIK